MAENTEVQQQQPPVQEPAVDVAALQAQLRAAEAERARLAQEHQMAMGYLQQMTAMVQQQTAQQQPVPPAADDDDLFVQNPKRFKEAVVKEAEDRARTLIQQQVGPAAQTIALSQLAAHRERAVSDGSMPNFGKWEQEVYQVLAPAGVDQALNYGTWRQAYNIVAAQHLDELVNERLAQRPREVDEGETPVEAPPPTDAAAERYKINVGRIDAPGPVSTGGRGQTPITQPRRAPPRLTQEERIYAARENMTAEEYVKYRDSDSEDIMGFNGRDKV